MAGNDGLNVWRGQGFISVFVRDKFSHETATASIGTGDNMFAYPAYDPPRRSKTGVDRDEAGSGRWLPLTWLTPA